MSRCLSDTVSWCHGVSVSRCLDDRVSRCIGVLVSPYFGDSVSRCHGAQCFGALVYVFWCHDV